MKCRTTNKLFPPCSLSAPPFVLETRSFRTRAMHSSHRAAVVVVAVYLRSIRWLRRHCTPHNPSGFTTTRAHKRMHSQICLVSRIPRLVYSSALMMTTRACVFDECVHEFRTNCDVVVLAGCQTIRRPAGVQSGAVCETSRFGCRAALVKYTSHMIARVMSVCVCVRAGSGC